jgi:hypothetical protein
MGDAEVICSVDKDDDDNDEAETRGIEDTEDTGNEFGP